MEGDDNNPPVKSRRGLNDAWRTTVGRGNWKMNGLSGSLAEIDAIRQAVDEGGIRLRRAARLPTGDAARASGVEDRELRS